MKYTIISPYGSHSITAESDLTAALAVILLGSGEYGLYDQDGEAVIPIFGLSDPSKLAKWLESKGLSSELLDSFHADNIKAIATVLESLSLDDGSVPDKGDPSFGLFDMAERAKDRLVGNAG